MQLEGDRVLLRGQGCRASLISDRSPSLQLMTTWSQASPVPVATAAEPRHLKRMLNFATHCSGTQTPNGNVQPYSWHGTYLTVVSSQGLANDGQYSITRAFAEPK